MVMDLDGCSVLDDTGSSVLSSISVDASVVSSLTDCDAGVDVCNSCDEGILVEPTIDSIDEDALSEESVTV